MLELNINFDQPDLPAEGEYRRHLLARVTPPQQEQTDDVAPLDLALVIDASKAASTACGMHAVAGNKQWGLGHAQPWRMCALPLPQRRLHLWGPAA